MNCRVVFSAGVAWCVAFAGADKVDDWARAQMSARHIPGMVVGVYRQGKPVKVAAYGYADLESSAPMMQNSIFEVCSITKQFTAAGVLLLAEDGRLGLDDPVKKHLPDWPDAWKSVTIRHLLTHTSGINDDLYVDWELPLLETIKVMSPTDTVPTGQGWEYSNFCYMIAGRVIEKLSGKDYYEFLQERIFDKLGMKDTHPNNIAVVMPRRVHGYFWNEKTFWNHPGLNQKMGMGSGGLVSTVHDLNIWSEALKHNRILGSESRAAMLLPGKLGQGDVAWPEGMGSSYGLGVFLAGTPGHRIEKHSGSWGDSSAQLTRFLDDDVTVIVLTNVGHWGQRMFVGEAILELVSSGKYLPDWEAQSDPEPARLKRVETLCASVSAGLLDKTVVTGRLAKLLATERIAEPLKNADPSKFRFVRRVPQGKSTVYVYRSEGENAEIHWFLFQPDGRIALLGSFSIAK